MKNLDYIVKKVSSDLNIDEKIVDEIYRYYWRESILSSIRSTKHTAIYVPFIGTFYLSYFKVREEILLIIKRIKTIRTSSKYKEEKKKQIELYYINYLQNLLERRRELFDDHHNMLLKIKNKKNAK